jgi:hypothetical protein
MITSHRARRHGALGRPEAPRRKSSISPHRASAWSPS